jgi:hypothetical protein
LRNLVSGQSGMYTNWTNVPAVRENPTMFVRMLNLFDGRGVIHKHSRVNFLEVLEEKATQEYDLLGFVFESQYARYGIYVDPVEEFIFNRPRHWDLDIINEHVHCAFASPSDQKRIVQYYWPDLKMEQRLSPMTADTVVEEDDGARDRYIAEMLQRLERRERLIEPGGGRRPNAQEVRGVDWATFRPNIVEGE